MKEYFLTGESLHRDVVYYNDTGHHRTGSAGELKTDEWITRELTDTGLEVSFQNLSVRQYFPKTGEIVVGDQTITCFPLWYPFSKNKYHGKGQIVNYPAENPNLKNKICLCEGDASFQSHQSAIEIVGSIASAGALAIIIISNSRSGRIAAINTPAGVAPWPIPVLITGAKDKEWLVSAVQQQQFAHINLSGSDKKKTPAKNIFGRWYSNDQPWFMISTPKSGWFDCGGERGTGVALALGIARWIGKRKPAMNYWLDFNTGHELDNLGMQQFLAAAAPPPEKVKGWIHLGANIATFKFNDGPSGLQRISNLSKHLIVGNDSNLLTIAKQSFSSIEGIHIYENEAIGELVPVISAGYRGICLHGGHYYFFHTPADGPQGSAPELLEPIMEALINMLEVIEQS